jgi:hypothetical protein
MGALDLNGFSDRAALALAALEARVAAAEPRYPRGTFKARAFP